MNKKILLSLLTVLTILFLTAQTCQFAVVNTGLAADCEGEGDVVCNEDGEAYQCQIAEYGLGYYVTRMDQTSDTEYCGAEEAAAEEEPEEEEEDAGEEGGEETEPCSDTDNGQDQYSQGTVSVIDADGAETSYTDDCGDLSTVKEYYCSDAVVSYSLMSCGDGYDCSNGECITETDTDGDGLSDLQEALEGVGTDPTDADSDDDGLSDYDELTAGEATDPMDSDSDDDGVSDGDEVADGTDPLAAAPSTTAYEAMDISNAWISDVSATKPYFANKERRLGMIMAYLDETDGTFHDSDGGNPTAASPLFISVSSYYWKTAGGLSEELEITIVTDNADSSRLKLYLPQLAADALGSDATYMAFYIADDGSTYYADSENDGVETDLSDLLPPEEALTTDHLARASEGQPTRTTLTLQPVVKAKLEEGVK